VAAVGALDKDPGKVGPGVAQTLHHWLEPWGGSPGPAA
jgi:hypothetical protein